MLIAQIAFAATAHIDAEAKIKPKNLGNYVAGKVFMLDVAADLDQQWFIIKGFEKGHAYRAELNGGLVAGTRLLIITDNGRAANSCGNSVRKAMTKLSCYFAADRISVILAVNNMSDKALHSRVSFVPISDPVILENFHVSEPTAKPLNLGTETSGFVLANEIGTNSKHYFQYIVEAENSRGLQVRLFELSHPAQLTVMWIDGFCSHEMMKVDKNQISCKLPEKFLGDLTIVVDGNNVGNSQMNAATIENGGSFYRLVVEQVLP